VIAVVRRRVIWSIYCFTDVFDDPRPAVKSPPRALPGGRASDGSKPRGQQVTPSGPASSADRREKRRSWLDFAAGT
jgi:hypothetical protein